MARAVVFVTATLIVVVSSALLFYILYDVAAQLIYRTECQQLGYGSAGLSGYPDFRVVCIIAVPLTDLQEGSE